MKALRAFLFVAGLGLISWGVLNYFSDIAEEVKQALPKVLLGVIAVIGAILAKNRR